MAHDAAATRTNETARRRAWATAAVATTLLLSTVGLASAPAGAGTSQRERNLVLTFSADADLATMQGLAALDVEIRHTYTEVFKGVAVRTDVPAKQLREIPGVTSVVLDQQVQVDPPTTDPPTTDPSTTTTTIDTSTTTTDPSSTSTSTSTTSTTSSTTTTTVAPPQQFEPWGLDRIDQRQLPFDGNYKAPSAGKGVTAFIVDSGINSAHAAFGGRIVGGYSAFGNSPEDCNGHGTHVAGTVGGAGIGVAPGVNIVPVRVADCEGGVAVSDVAAGIDWIAANHASGEPAVANISIGPGKGQTTSAVITAALEGLVTDGVSVVTSAGNLNIDACDRSYGWNTPGVIVVGATDRTDVRANYSNFGKCVDVFAPGDDIESTYIGDATAVARESGTSMAAPHVAGAVAVLLSLDPWRTPTDVESEIVRVATPDVVQNPGAESANRLLFSQPDRAAVVAPASADVLVVRRTVTPTASVLGAQQTQSTLATTGVDSLVMVIFALALLTLGFLSLRGSVRIEAAAASAAAERAARDSERLAKALPIQVVRRNRASE
jgi:subtilisin family serine protease